jgi:hypothetical protein
MEAAWATDQEEEDRIASEAGIFRGVEAAIAMPSGEDLVATMDPAPVPEAVVGLRAWDLAEEAEASAVEAGAAGGEDSANEIPNHGQRSRQ